MDFAHFVSQPVRMEEAEEQAPWAALIEQRRTNLRPKVSARKAASLANLSEGRWRQIIKGYQSAGAGHRVPVHGPADTVARMARVVGLTPDEMARAGRSDVAAVMRQVERVQQRGDDRSEGDPAVLPLFSDLQLLDELRARVERRQEMRPRRAAPADISRLWHILEAWRPMTADQVEWVAFKTEATVDEVYDWREGSAAPRDRQRQALIELLSDDDRDDLVALLQPIPKPDPRNVQKVHEKLADDAAERAASEVESRRPDPPLEIRDAR